MEKQKPQSFAHHARFVPIFHFVAMPILMVNAIWRLVQLKDGVSFASIMAVLVAVALVIVALSARVFAIAVQDRIICLETRLRLERRLPADLRPRVPEYQLEQLVALRFASDEELPALARQVLDEKLSDRKAIKQRVKNWRPDYMRA